MPLSSILVIALILLLVGSVWRTGPVYANYGFAPGGVLGLVLVVVLVLLLLGRL